jgi:hypothetical protein
MLTATIHLLTLIFSYTAFAVSLLVYLQTNAHTLEQQAQGANTREANLLEKG